MNKRLRDVLLFVSGLTFLSYQNFFTDGGADPTMVGAALVMMVGAPGVYRLLDRFDGSKGPDAPKEE